MFGNDYPFNLIRAIYRDSETDNTHTETTYLKGLHEQIDNLSPVERKSILLRYKQELTLKGCGEHLGVGPERARQIIEKALQKLRHPSRLRYYEIVPKSEMQELEKECKDLSLENETLKDALQTLNEHDVDPYVIIMMATIIRPEHLLTPISELNLSTRAYNALNRAGLDTVRDVLELTDKSLLSRRAIGKKVMEEVKIKIRAHLLLPEHYQDGVNTHEGNAV